MLELWSRWSTPTLNNSLSKAISSSWQLTRSKKYKSSISLLVLTMWRMRVSGLPLRKLVTGITSWVESVCPLCLSLLMSFSTVWWRSTRTQSSSATLSSTISQWESRWCILVLEMSRCSDCWTIPRQSSTLSPLVPFRFPFLLFPTPAKCMNVAFWWWLVRKYSGLSPSKASLKSILAKF